MTSPRTIATVLLLILVAGLVLWQAAFWANELAHREIRERSAGTLRLVIENLRGDLGRYSFQPRLLSMMPSVRALVAAPTDRQLAAVLNSELEQINAVIGAMDTYVMDSEGHTIAASNWASERPFIGRNFSFRPYFQDAKVGLLGRYFALGTTSGERGYYFAHPVRVGGTIAGVVTVKLDISRLEATWSSQDSEFLVIDGEGVVFLSSRSEWRLRTLGVLGQASLERIARSKRYADTELEAMSWREADGLVSVAGPPVGRRGADHTTASYLKVEASMPEVNWRVVILTETTGVARQVLIAVAVAAFMLASLALAAATLHQRRRRLADRLAFQEAATLGLEERIRERTLELETTNTQLRAEVAERVRAEAELRRTQADLIEASKLAALGRLSAGLSHELNQPLAAIRSYADNAEQFIARANEMMARSNLRQISEMTERMARIIRNLRTYARNEPLATRPTALAPAIDSALSIVAPRIEALGVDVILDIADDPPTVWAGDVRLQQVLVNLLTNAIDAMREKSNPRIMITARRAGDDIEIVVRDEGPGIAPDDLPRIFDPFFSTKGVGEGMGLGLSISYGLVKQFGGGLRARNHPEGGAEFVVVLHVCEAPLEKIS